MYNKDAELRSVPFSKTFKVHSEGVDFVYPYGDVIPLSFDKSYVECKVKRSLGNEEVLKGYIHNISIELDDDGEIDAYFFIAPIEGPDKYGFIRSSQWLYASYKDIIELKADKRLISGEWQTIDNFRDI